jgi:DNA-binding PadR family transcriptional regulator
MVNMQKEVQGKLTKGLLDFIILQKLNTNPAHGYEVIMYIRKSFGIYLGPSTIYPAFAVLEKKHYVKSEWDLSKDRPRKMYKITVEGQSVLNFAENSLSFLCRKINNNTVLNEVKAEAPALQRQVAMVMGTN